MDGMGPVEGWVFIAVCVLIVGTIVAGIVLGVSDGR
jgi:hypothetical protein